MEQDVICHFSYCCNAALDDLRRCASSSRWDVALANEL